ncbi:hypothetical protein LPW36_09700 [Jinshanibacter sp. LJY008]|uniref:Uncharacterized protein n=1 Tax=Limnobaculum eriocheiris TaxID=2897391 RepID=A0A9X1MV97_9GAMM|nr:hypothetical protein [Limnobaculum eriocheiris]MCD1126271.1 hypothetical protein [Limnobaculum eriocheiris]
MSLVIKRSLLALVIPASLVSVAYADTIENCEVNKDIIINNHLTLLSIPEFNHAREVETVTESDNTRSAFYYKFNYDRCGQLTDMYAQITRNELRFRIDSSYDISKNQQGWKNSYNVTLFGMNKLFYAREGAISYHADDNGLIVNSTDNYISASDEKKAENGITSGIYKTDDKFRMAYSLLSGTDESVNGEYRFFYQPDNKPFALISPTMSISYLYDEQQRASGMIEITVSPYYLGSKKTDCLEWNERNDCTRSVSKELEMFPAYIVDRTTVLRSTYTYW